MICSEISIIVQALGGSFRPPGEIFAWRKAPAVSPSREGEVMEDQEIAGAHAFRDWAVAMATFAAARRQEQQQEQTPVPPESGAPVPPP